MTKLIKLEPAQDIKVLGRTEMGKTNKTCICLGHSTSPNGLNVWFQANLDLALRLSVADW